MTRRGTTVLSVLLIGLVAAGSAQAATFTVNLRSDAADRNAGNGACDTSTKRGLQCALRAAIEESNALGGRDRIKFDIGGASTVKTISPASALPDVTEPVKINGYSQSGASVNTQTTGDNANLLIELDGTMTSGGASGLKITAGDSVVRGLAINDFSTGLELRTGGENKVLGNFIGTDPSGTVGAGNNTGIAISESSGNKIGGTSAAARNIVSANITTGISIFGLTGAPANGNRVLGNLIGTDAAGTGDLGNGEGGAGGNGVRINGQEGTTLNNEIGGTAAGSGNVIAFSGYIGVNILEGTGNSVLSNSIFGSNLMGINTDGEGVAANDDDDPDVGANNRQNYPVVTDADSAFFGDTTIEGTLSSTPSTTYTIQFFYNRAADEEDAEELEEGRKFLGSTSATTNANGDASFSGGFAVLGLDGGYATATATDPFGNPSEFSDGQLIDGPVIEPTP